MLNDKPRRCAKCVVPGCTDMTSQRRTIPIKPIGLFREWVRRISNPRMKDLPPDRVRSRFLICNRHFSRKCQFYPNSKRLIPGSMPTLHLPVSLTEPALPWKYHPPEEETKYREMRIKHGITPNDGSGEEVKYGGEEEDSDIDSPNDGSSHSVLRQLSGDHAETVSVNVDASIEEDNSKNEVVIEGSYIKMEPSEESCMQEMNRLEDCDDESGEIEPLYITNFLNGNCKEGRRLSEVVPLAGNVKSHAGYFTVNKEHDSHMFFWFFPRSKEVPIIVWINGPMEIGTNGVFRQTGPYYYDGKDITLREYAWCNLFNVLYLDAPVGNGYSFTNGNSGRPTDSDTAGADLYSTLAQFLDLFYELKDNPLFITGMGMGAKLALALARRCIAYGDTNFKGILLANPLLDLDIQMDYENYLTALGLLEEVSASHYRLKESELKSLLHSDNGSQEFLKKFLEFCIIPDCVLCDVTALDSTFSYVKEIPDENKHWLELVHSVEMKFAVHVGSEAVWLSGEKALASMPSLIMESSLPLLGQLVEQVKVMLLNGQEDVRFPYPMMMACARSLDWSSKNIFCNSKRYRIQREAAGRVEGFSTRCQMLSVILVRSASHFVFSDRPDFTLQLLVNFMKDAPQILTNKSKGSKAVPS